VCGSRAWARSRLGRVTPETATYASLWRAFLEDQSQPQNLLSESLYLSRDKSTLQLNNKLRAFSVSIYRIISQIT
jgi:hypothetical protein